MTLKTISLFLCIIMIALSIPLTPISADAACKIISANDLYYAYGSGTELACELIDADGGYVHCVASPGSYGDNQLKYTFSHPELVLYDLPYVVVEYKTDSQNKFVDLLHGSNWLNTGINHITDGAWHKLYFNVNDIKDNPAGTVPAPGVAGTSIVLKPWKSHSKVLGNRQYYDIRYVGFFKSQKDAEAFVYDPATHKNEIELNALENIPFYEADENKINEYLKKANEQKQAIIYSTTDVSFTGTAYYVSSKGDDNNDGLTPATAFKTVAKVSDARFLKPGDAVLFERTSVFRCTDTLNTVEGVTYSAYGSGAKPKLIGAIDASFESMWKETEVKNVYVFSQIIDDIPGDLHNDVGQIIFDSGKAWGIKLQDGHWIGTNSNGLEMIATGTPSVKGPEGVRHDLEYWYDHASGRLYLYSKNGNPAKRFTTIDICPNITAIRFTSNNVIDNLDIYGYGRHGLAGSGENITVQNCILSFIGGGIHWQGSPTRLGNAVQIYGTLAKNFTIKNCYASQIYDCGFTVQYQDNSKGQDVIFENIEMCGNITEYANTGLEVWLVNHKKYNNPATFAIKNMRLHHNFTLFSGYGWSQQRTNKDSNIFYGDPTETNTIHENCSVDNNVGMFSTKWINYLRYPGTKNYNFNNNIYFQHENKLYGGVPSNPELGTGLVGEYPYTKDTLSRLLATGIEPNSVFYRVKADYKVPPYPVKDITFTDVSSTHWAYDAVRASVMRGLFNGVSADKFAPDSSMTRAMVATVLARLSSDNTNTQKSAFADANENAWFSNALNFAYTYELVDKAEKLFRPDDAITREELADMLYRFAYAGYKCNKIADPVLTFSDADKVSPQYAAGIAFATSNGIITGYEDKSVRPKNTATRAEVATMIGRFLNLYTSLENDFSRLAKQGESRVYSGTELEKILSVASGDKKLGEGELATLKISPKPAGQGDPYPQINLLERSLGSSFEELPYIKLRYKTTDDTSLLLAKLTKSNKIADLFLSKETGEWSDVVFSVYDIFAPGSAYYDGVASGKLTLSLWHRANAPVYGKDYAEIEYIGFFSNKKEALEYEGEIARLSAEVGFYVNGELIDTVTVKKGTPLSYTDKSLQIAGYRISGWSVPEGSIVNADLRVDAIFEKDESTQSLIFTAENMEVTSADQFTGELKEEKGIKYYHFTVANGKLSDDHSRINVSPKSELWYNIGEYPYMKITYRTNPRNSSGFELNIKTNDKTRVWGPRIEYPEKGKWTEQTLDLRTVGWNGGESVAANLKSEQYFDNYFTEPISLIIIKPYKAVGIWMDTTEYYDIAGVAFFTDKESADKYSMLK